MIMSDLFLVLQKNSLLNGMKICEIENLMGNGVQKGQNSVRLCLTVWGMACMLLFYFFYFLFFFLSLSAAVVTGASRVKAPLPVFLLVMQVCTKSTLFALRIGTDKPEQTV